MTIHDAGASNGSRWRTLPRVAFAKVYVKVKVGSRDSAHACQRGGGGESGGWEDGRGWAWHHV